MSAIRAVQSSSNSSKENREPRRTVTAVVLDVVVLSVARIEPAATAAAGRRVCVFVGVEKIDIM